MMVEGDRHEARGVRRFENDTKRLAVFLCQDIGHTSAELRVPKVTDVYGDDGNARESVHPWLFCARRRDTHHVDVGDRTAQVMSDRTFCVALESIITGGNKCLPAFCTHNLHVRPITMASLAYWAPLYFDVSSHVVFLFSCNLQPMGDARIRERRRRALQRRR